MMHLSPENSLSATLLALESPWSDASAEAEGPPLGLLRVPGPRGKALVLLRASGATRAAYVALPSSEARSVALSTAVLVRGRGDDRFESARRGIETAFSRFDCAPPESVRFFGGAAFLPRGATSGSWSSFEDALFVLPRLTYNETADGAELLLVHAKNEDAARLEEALGRLARLLEEEPDRRAPHARPLALRRSDSLDEVSFVRAIEAARTLIAANSLEKVVVARRTTLDLADSPEVDVLLDRLDTHAGDCFRFAFRLGETTFLGASPETLVRKTGLSIATEALAGTRPKSQGDAARELMESEKERFEHRLVVDSIASTLAPRCSALEVAERPRVIPLRSLYHLQTPIHGRLREPTHVLDVVAALHPTPAVAGVPRLAALAFLETHEVAERGWYASPFGFVDARGDGHFVVALRSALLTGSHVELYAGAGIVAQSVPSEEFAETEVKMSAMLGALGFEEA